jgi:DNA (cytosine-5)-methyltransferase 1
MRPVIDLFAGPGGWDEGLKLLGISRTLGLDLDGDACETAEAAGHWRWQVDLAKADPVSFARQWGGVSGLVASPPCQGFSAAGAGIGRGDVQQLLNGIEDIVGGDSVQDIMAELHRTMVDKRSILMLEPLRWTQDLSPEWFAFEQVPLALPVWQQMSEVMIGLGYSTWFGTVNAEQYGVPQTRRRALLLGSRTRHVTGPAPTHSKFYSREPERQDEDVLPWISMADALGWGKGQEVADMVLERRLYSRRTDNLEWPANRPATTVLGGEIVRTPGATQNRMNASTKSRNDGIRVSQREAGVLQSFRADYPWRGGKTKQFEQIGNAVPPLLAAKLIECLI